MNREIQNYSSSNGEIMRRDKLYPVKHLFRQGVEKMAADSRVVYNDEGLGQGSSKFEKKNTVPS